MAPLNLKLVPFYCVPRIAPGKRVSPFEGAEVKDGGVGEARLAPYSPATKPSRWGAELHIEAVVSRDGRQQDAGG